MNMFLVKVNQYVGYNNTKVKSIIHLEKIFFTIVKISYKMLTGQDVDTEINLPKVSTKY